MLWHFPGVTGIRAVKLPACLIQLRVFKICSKHQVQWVVVLGWYAHPHWKVHPESCYNSTLLKSECSHERTGFGKLVFFDECFYKIKSAANLKFSSLQLQGCPLLLAPLQWEDMWKGTETGCHRFCPNKFVSFFQTRFDPGENKMVRKRPVITARRWWGNPVKSAERDGTKFMAIFKTINIIVDSFMYFLLHNVPPPHTHLFCSTVLYKTLCLCVIPLL